MLTKEQRSARVEFGKNWIISDFKNIIFTDERISVFLDLTANQNIGLKIVKLNFIKIKFGRDSIIVHLSIYFYDKVVLCEMIGNYTTPDCKILLGTKVLSRIF